MWHKPCRTFHPWCLCIKTRCLFGWWVVACSTPSQYLNQCWFTVNWTIWNTLKWKSNQNKKNYSFKKVRLNISSAKWWPFCPWGNELTMTWWRHQMKTFSALLAFCAGNSPVTDEFPAQRPVTQSFDVFCDMCLNKRLNKQWPGWWFETPSHSLWHHCNE